MKKPCPRCGHLNDEQLEYCLQCHLVLLVKQNETDRSSFKYWLFITLALLLPEAVLLYYYPHKQERGFMPEHLPPYLFLGFVIQLVYLVAFVQIIF